MMPCSFFFFAPEIPEEQVYTSPPQDLKHLQARIRRKIDVLSHEPAMVRRAEHDTQRFSQLHFVLMREVDTSKVLVDV